MRQLDLYVGGMSCRRCVREVTSRLRDVSGVVTMSASSDDCTVQLSGSMRFEDVLATFAGTAFQVRLVTATDGDSGETAAGKPAP